MLRGQAVVFTSILLFLQVFSSHGHFVMQSPMSREKLKWPSENTRFFPVSGGGENRPGGSCLGLPPTPKTTISPGPFTLEFEIGNGAAHVGPCTAFLVDAATGQQTQIGAENDCMKNARLQVNIPASPPCTECVLKVDVRAEHLGPDKPEMYDSCADVIIAGAGGGAAPAPAPPAGAGAAAAAAANPSPGAPASGALPTRGAPEPTPQGGGTPAEKLYAQQLLDYNRQLDEYNRAMAAYRQLQGQKK